MKNQTRHKPTAGKFSLLRQLCNFIPPHLVPQLARQTGVEEPSRTFSPWSHVASLLYAQLTHALGQRRVRRAAPALRPILGLARSHAAARPDIWPAPLADRPNAQNETGFAGV
jgi:hypothetical protein